MKHLLTIAGSDSSGGAGIQADLKTFAAHGTFGMSVITAVTAQNTQGVTMVQDIDAGVIEAQIDAVFDDIRVDAVKIGMVPSKALVQMTADRLRFHRAERIVLDPVMVATSGSRLMETETVAVLEKELMPLALVVTPNIPEAEIMAGMKIREKSEMEAAAVKIWEKFGCAALVKGGHSVSDADDFLFDGRKGEWFCGKRIDNPNTHGTGCTLSSAIASNLAKGYSLSESVRRSKDYLSLALAEMLNLGAGSGPMDHGFALTGTFAE